jgi:hypothetical protein
VPRRRSTRAFVRALLAAPFHAHATVVIGVNGSTIIEHGEPAPADKPIDTLWLARRTIDNQDNRVEAKTYVGATTFYLEQLADPQGSASVELVHHQDSTGFGRIETVDGTLAFVDPDETAQLAPGDAVFLIDATFELRVINDGSATIWMAGLGMQRMGSCGAAPC